MKKDIYTNKTKELVFVAKKLVDGVVNHIGVEPGHQVDVTTLGLCNDPPNMTVEELSEMRKLLSTHPQLKSKLMELIHYVYGGG